MQELLKKQNEWNQCANYVSSFCNWAMGTMSESCYDNPLQEWCVGKMCGAKMLHCKHKGCKVRVHSICQIDWLKRHWKLFRGELWWSNFLPTAQQVLQELCSIEGKAISCVRRVDACLGLLVYAKKSLKSINNAPACYSYHNPNTLVCSETLALVEQ